MKKLFIGNIVFLEDLTMVRIAYIFPGTLIMVQHRDGTLLNVEQTDLHDPQEAIIKLFPLGKYTATVKLEEEEHVETLWITAHGANSIATSSEHPLLEIILWRELWVGDITLKLIRVTNTNAIPMGNVHDEYDEPLT